MKKYHWLLPLVYLLFTACKSDVTNPTTTIDQATAQLSESGVNCIAIDGNAIYAGTKSDGVFLSTDNGKTWVKRNKGLVSNSNVSAISISGNDIFIGTVLGVYHSTDSGKHWTPKPIINLYYGSFYVNAIGIKGNSIFTSINSGVFLSTDNGNSWTKKSYGQMTIPYSIAFFNDNIFLAGANFGIYRS